MSPAKILIFDFDDTLIKTPILKNATPNTNYKIYGDEYIPEEQIQKIKDNFKRWLDAGIKICILSLAYSKELKEFFIDVLKFKNVTLFVNSENTVDKNILIMGTPSITVYDKFKDKPEIFKVDMMEIFLQHLRLMTSPGPLPKIQFMDDNYGTCNYMKTKFKEDVVSVHHITPRGNVDMTFKVADEFVSSQFRPTKIIKNRHKSPPFKNKNKNKKKRTVKSKSRRKSRSPRRRV